MESFRPVLSISWVRKDRRLVVHRGFPAAISDKNQGATKPEMAEGTQIRPLGPGIADINGK